MPECTLTFLLHLPCVTYDKHGSRIRIWFMPYGIRDRRSLKHQKNSFSCLFFFAKVPSFQTLQRGLRGSHKNVYKTFFTVNRKRNNFCFWKFYVRLSAAEIRGKTKILNLELPLRGGVQVRENLLQSWKWTLSMWKDTSPNLSRQNVNLIEFRLFDRSLRGTEFYEKSSIL